MLVKLKKLGVADSVLDWMFSYLTSRTQAVVDDLEHISPWLSTTLGVPHGSVLGPILFTLFINDLGSVLRHSQHMIFADDTQIYVRCSPNLLPQAIGTIAEAVQAISWYAKENGLKLNLSKSKVLIMGRDSYVRNIDLSRLPVISVDGVSIPYVDDARNLGVMLTSSLSWGSHVRHVSHRVHFSIRKLKFQRNVLSRHLRGTLIT